MFNSTDCGANLVHVERAPNMLLGQTQRPENTPMP